MGSSVAACMDSEVFFRRPRKSILLLKTGTLKIEECSSSKNAAVQTEDNSTSTTHTISIDTRTTEVNDEVLKLIDMNSMLQQMFVSCELGDVADIRSTFASYPEVKSLINDTRQCFLLENTLEITLLHLSCAHGHVDIASLLLDSCSAIDVNQTDSTYSMTALHFAVSLNRTDIVKLLLDRSRVSANERNIDGKSPLHLAIEYGYPDIVETFLKTRPNVDLRFKDFDGNNVVHLAAYHPSFAVMKMFVDHISLIQSYNDYFEINDTSTSSRHVQLLEVLSCCTHLIRQHILHLQCVIIIMITIIIIIIPYIYKCYHTQAVNYSHESPLEILRNVIEMIQKSTQIATNRDTGGQDIAPKASSGLKDLFERHHDIDDLLTEAVNSFIYLSDAIRVLSPVGTISLTTLGNHSPSSSSLNSFAESEAFEVRYRGDSNNRDVSCSWSPQREASYISVSKKLTS
jgi:ankyrin repeat protein